MVNLTLRHLPKLFWRWTGSGHEVRYCSSNYRCRRPSRIAFLNLTSKIKPMPWGVNNSFEFKENGYKSLTDKIVLEHAL